MFTLYLLASKFCFHHCHWPRARFGSHGLWVGLTPEVVSEPWWRHQMEKNSSSLALCVENSPVTGEFPAPRPVTRSFEVFFDLRLNKRLSKQWLGWWLETQSCSLWRHCSDVAARCSYCPFEPITSPRIVFISHDCSPTSCACINSTAIDLITMKDRICYGCMSALDTFKNPPFSYSDAQWTCTMTFPFHALQKIRS